MVGNATRAEGQEKDLRTFLADYRATYPEDVLDIHVPIKAEHECTAIGKHFEDVAKYPLVLLHHVITISGRISKFPLMINVLGDRRKLAHAIESTFEDVAIDWRRRLTEGRCQPAVMGRSEAPVKENVLLGKQVNLLDLPAMRFHENGPRPLYHGRDAHDIPPEELDRKLRHTARLHRRPAGDTVLYGSAVAQCYELCGP